MGLIALPAMYFWWHYTEALSSMVRIWLDVLWFIRIFFSFTTLLKTLFSPWKRLGEEKRKGFDPGDVGEVVLVSLLMRFLGAMIRIWFIVIALIAFALTFLGGILFFILWLLAPVAVPALFLYGLTLAL